MINFDYVQEYEDHIGRLMRSTKKGGGIKGNSHHGHGGFSSTVGFSHNQHEHFFSEDFHNQHLVHTDSNENIFTEKRGSSTKNPWTLIASAIFSPFACDLKQFNEYVSKRMEIEERIAKFPFRNLMMAPLIEKKKEVSKSVSMNSKK